MNHLYEKISKEETVRLRRKYIGKACELYFRENPLKIVRSKGQYMYDERNKRYLDCINNVAHVGHCHVDVIRAEVEQAHLLNTNSRFLHDNLVTYAEKLCSLFPDPLSVCFLVNSGSEANDLALQLARSYTKHTDVIILDHAYHGNLSSLMAISPYKFNRTGGIGKPEWVHVASCPDIYRGKYACTDFDNGKKETKLSSVGFLYAEDVRLLVKQVERKGGEICAFISESALSCGGQIIPPKHYLSHVYSYIRQAGGVCIADEVQVGFGRMGRHWWAFELQGPDVIPDIITLGKPMGNGYPVSAVITTQEIAQYFNADIGFFSTFGGNPVSCAIANAVLDVIEKEKLMENAEKVGSFMLRELKNLKCRHSMIGDVRGMGFFIGIELIKFQPVHCCYRDCGRRNDNIAAIRKELLLAKIPATNEAKIVVNRLRDKFTLVSRDGPDNNVIKLKPPMVFTQEDAANFVRNLDEVLNNVSLHDTS